MKYASPPHSFYLFVLLGVALFFVGCNFPSYGEARFEASGVSLYGECLESAFPMEAAFFAARKRRDSIGLFIQTRGGLDTSYDLVYIEIDQPAFVAKNLGQAIPLSAPDAVDPIVRARVLLRDSCPSLWESFYVSGSIVFDVLDLDDARRVEGEFVMASLVHARSGEVAATAFEGYWAYDVLRGRPHEEYFPLVD